ncbi:MAG: hypothetical protein ABL866_17035 [Devosia sp.]
MAEPDRPGGWRGISVYKRPGFDLEGLEADYADLTISGRRIYAKYHISKSTLTKIVREQGWPWRAPKPVNRHDIIDKLFRLLDRQTKELEASKVKSGSAEVMALSKLVASLGRLIDIKDAESAKRRANEAPRHEMSEIKRKLIERIEQLKRA